MHKRTPLFVMVLAFLLALSACAGASSEPTAVPQQTDAPQPTDPPTSTDTPSPTDTLVPTDTPTPAPTHTPTPTPVPPTPTSEPIGLTRSNPYPKSEIVSAPNWDVQVQEVIRGEEAWHLIQAANQFNDPPPEAMEYLLVKLHVKSTYDDDEEQSISASDFKVTGDRLIRYRSASVVKPDPPLDAELFSGAETEGWTAYLVGEQEGNLILITDELFSFDDDRFRFIALQEGAAVTVPSDLADINPTDLGSERTNPAPLGETVTTDNWQVTILEAVRGDEAWAMVQEANQFNDPPDEGMEYVTVRAHVRYISTVDESASIDDFHFKTTGSAGVLYDRPSIVDPRPQLDVTLYPGGEYEGWVALQAAQGETDLLAVFDPPFSMSSTNRRFISLEP